jgi:hypothetical protein
MNCASEINKNKLSVVNFMKANNNDVNNDAVLKSIYNPSSTGPLLICDKWNQVKVEFEVQFTNGKNMNDEPFRFYRAPHKNLIAKENYFISGEANRAEACLHSGSCFVFEIAGEDAVKSYSVKVDGVQVISRSGPNGKVAESVSVDATQKKFQNRRCSWLRNQANKDSICSSNTAGFSALCPKTCNSC